MVCSAAWYFKDALKRCIEYFPFQLRIIWFLPIPYPISRPSIDVFNSFSFEPPSGF